MIEHAHVLQDSSIKTAAGISVKICEEIGIHSFKVAIMLCHSIDQRGQNFITEAAIAR